MALKMYILIKDNIDLGHAILAAAHGSLSGYLTFVENELQNEPERDRFIALGGRTSTQKWVDESFRKVVCKVTDAEFEKAKTYDIPKRIMTESGLGGIETAIVFAPQEEWPKFFSFLKLYK